MKTFEEYKKQCRALYVAHDRKIDCSIMVVSLLVLIVSLFYPCLLFDIIGCVLGVVGLLYWSSVFRYLHNSIDRDLLLINGYFLLKSVTVSVLTPYVIYFICFVLSFIPGMELSNMNLASEAFGGVDPYDHNMPHGRPYLWTIYFHYIDPGNQHMTNSLVARGIVGICSMLGVFVLNGLLVSSLIGWIDKRKESWQSGAIRYHYRNFKNKNFAVVIGANEIVSSVIKNLLSENAPDEINNRSEKNNCYVILQTSRNTEEVRQELSSHLSDKDMRKVILYFAQRDSVKELKCLFLDKATEIYVLGESTEAERGETYHDAMNMRCVNLISDILAEIKDSSSDGQYRRKVCKVMFDYQSTYSIFQFSDISNRINQTLVFIPFNRYESWARKVIVEGYAMSDCHYNRAKEITYTPLDGNGISPESSEHVHLVVVGMSKMGVALGVQALLNAHYLNYSKAESESDNTRRNRLRTRITFIDAEADKEMNFFKGRYDNLFALMRHRYVDASDPDFVQKCSDFDGQWDDPFTKAGTQWAHLSDDGSNFIDAEVEFMKGEIESAGVRQYLKSLTDTDKESVRNSRLTIAICLTRTHQAISASLYMPNEVYKKVQEVWVYQKEASDIIDNLIDTEQTDLRYKKLRPFGMLYGDYMSDRTLYLKALLVNAAYDVNEKTYINFVDKDTYKDLRPTWKELTIDKKLSNKFFADSVYQKIRGVYADDPQSYSFKYITGFLKDCKEDDIKTIIQKLDDNKQILAICEHNRWNMQQLLLGYSPCTKDLDERFRQMNDMAKSDHGNGYKQWKVAHGYASMKPLEQYKLKRDDPDFRKLPIGIFNSFKNECKEGEYRIHPNICKYSHLPEIDYGAQDYDVHLNTMGINYILRFVDGHNNKNLHVDRPAVS